MRERAQQSCPALSKTPSGAEVAAFSRSASAKTTFADLPPSSSVTRFMVPAAQAIIFFPTPVEPVKATLATSGCSVRRWPTVLPGPTTTFTTPSGMPASKAMRSNSSAVSGVSSAGLRTTVVTGGERRGHLPARDGQREVPRDDEPDDAKWFAERHVHAAGDRDGVAEVPFRGSGIVAEGIRDHAHLAAGGNDRLASVFGLYLGQVLLLRLQCVGEPVQKAGPVGGLDGSPLRICGFGTGDRSVRVA